MKSSVLKTMLVAVALLASAAQFAQAAIEILVSSEAGDDGQRRVYRFDYDAGPLPGGGQNPLVPHFTDTAPFYPRGMEMGPDFKIYVAGSGSSAAVGSGLVKRYNIDGSGETTLISSGTQWFRGMTVDPASGDIFVSVHGTHGQRYSSTGVLEDADLPGVDATGAMKVVGGNLYTGTGNFINRFDLDGVLINQFPNTGHNNNDFTDLVEKDGIMYLVGGSESGVFRFHLATNTWLDSGNAWGNTGSAGLIYAGIAVAPNGQITVVRNHSNGGNAYMFRIDDNGTMLYPTEGYWFPMNTGGDSGEIVFTPEPASLALVGLGGLLMLKRRR